MFSDLSTMLLVSVFRSKPVGIVGEVAMAGQPENLQLQGKLLGAHLWGLHSSSMDFDCCPLHLKVRHHWGFGEASAG